MAIFQAQTLRISRSPESQRLWTDIQPHPLASTISANVACVSKNVKLMFFFSDGVHYARWITDFQD